MHDSCEYSRRCTVNITPDEWAEKATDSSWSKHDFECVEQRQFCAIFRMFLIDGRLFHRLANFFLYGSNICKTNVQARSVTNPIIKELRDLLKTMTVWVECREPFSLHRNELSLKVSRPSIDKLQRI